MCAHFFFFLLSWCFFSIKVLLSWGWIEPTTGLRRPHDGWMWILSYRNIQSPWCTVGCWSSVIILHKYLLTCMIVCLLNRCSSNKDFFLHLYISKNLDITYLLQLLLIWPLCMMSKEPSLNMVLCLVVGEYIFSSKGEWKKKKMRTC